VEVILAAVSMVRPGDFILPKLAREGYLPHPARP
jgi:hypothetical protein